MKKNFLMTFINHLIMIMGCLFLIIPVWLVFASSTHAPEVIHQNGMQWTIGSIGLQGYKEVLSGLGIVNDVDIRRMLLNSTIMGVGFAVGKVIISMLAAYGLVYFRFRGASFIFAAIFATLLLPLEVRIGPSYEVMTIVGKTPIIGQYIGTNSYGGLIIPLIASATGTFYFRQFFKAVPDELLEAAKLDNAGPFRFFKDILLPLSRTMIAAIFIIMFVVGWNQYMWPLLMTTKSEYTTIVMGIQNIMTTIKETNGPVPQYHRAFAMGILALIPPVAVVMIFQRWFVKGLLESEK
ncbi:MAG: ABC transporter permease subunit [Alphaproteobacteria bacterium]